MISPFSTLRIIAREYVRAHLDPNLLQTFTNTVLGLPYNIDNAMKVDFGKYEDRVEFYEKIPNGVLMLVLGVDVQLDWIETALWGVGFDNEMWFMERNIIYGQTLYSDPWEKLFEYINKPFYHESGVEMFINAAGIDTGFRTDIVYAFVKNSRNRNARTIFFPTRGSNRKMNDIAKVTYNRSQDIRRIDVGTDVVKSMISQKIGRAHV